jgi:hypothetical protein
MKQAIKVKFDNSIVEKLRNAFTSLDCVYKEAMQNARRAGASSVRFETKPGSLVIRDNGKGFNSLQDFLTLAGSGWDEEVRKREGAFGLGSFSMLYAADHIKVSSNNKSFEGFTADILNGLPVYLTESSVSEGSVIELAYQKLPEEEQLYDTIDRLARGFAIDVYVNEKPCDQYHRLDSDFTQTEVGKIRAGNMSVDELDKVSGSRYVHYDKRPCLYYQGLPVNDSSTAIAGGANIVHLEESLFEIRMPDRDVLIDSKFQIEKIEKQIEFLWRSFLIKQKSEMSSYDFANKCYQALVAWDCLELLNDVPFVPRETLYKVTQEPFCERIYHNDDFTEAVSVHRNDINKVLCLPTYVDAESIDFWLYAYHSEALCYSEGSLDEGHWLMQHLIKQFKVSVTPVNLTSRCGFNGDWVWCNCILTEAIEIAGPLGTIYEDKSIFASEGCLYIPKKADDGEAIFMMENFTSDEQFNQVAAARESGIFSAFLTRHNGKLIDAVKAALDNPYIKGLGLTDKQFKVIFHAKGFEVEEIAA